MRCRVIGLLLLLLANWLVWRPPGADLPYDLEGLRADLAGRFAMREERFEPSAMLPDRYLLLLAQRDQPLRSIYVGYYPVQGLAVDGPHDPFLCYAVQGWEVRAGRSLELDANGGRAVVPSAHAVSLEDSLFVTWWSQRPGQLPVDPSSHRLLGDLWDRWRLVRTDLAWVRVEWEAAVADEESFPQVQEALMAVMDAVDRAFHR